MKNEVKIRIFGGLFQNAGQNKVVKILIFASFFVIFKSKLAKTCKNEKSRFRQEFGVCSTQTPVIIYNRQATPRPSLTLPRPKFSGSDCKTHQNDNDPQCQDNDKYFSGAAHSRRG